MAKFLFYDSKIINILLSEEKPSGGAAVQAYAWIRGLLASGHEVCLVAEPVSPELLKPACRDIDIIPDYNPDKGIRFARWATHRMPHLYQTLKRVRPDYVYVGIPSWHSAVIGLLCRSLGIKYVQRVSNDFLVDDRFFSKYSRLHRYFQNVGFKLSHSILCQNEYQRSIISGKFPEKQVLKISNPIIISNTEKPVKAEDRSYIAWLGIFQYQKNLKLLYEIATQLPGENFSVAGKETKALDPETAFYLAKLKELPNVRFVGFLHRQEVAPFLANAKYLLNTSFYEGFSNTFLEAMMAGTPILTSTKVNPDSIISENNLGIVYEDARDLALQYKSVSQMRYEEMVGQVATYVLDNHDYKLLTSRLVRFLERVNGKKPVTTEYRLARY